MPRLFPALAMASLVIGILALSACSAEAPASASAAALSPPPARAVPLPACARGGVDYGAVIADSTLLVDAPGGMAGPGLPSGQLLCLHGPPTPDASGRLWQQVTALPTTIEPACNEAGASCPPTPAAMMTVLADCRVDADGAYTAACPRGWIPEGAFEAYSIGLAGDGAEDDGVATDGALPDEQRYALVEADGRRCEALARVGEDGLVQQPVLRLASKQSASRRIELAVGDGRYQARATHCVIDGDAALVLVQSDTQPSAALNQTLLRVDRVSFADGRVLASADLPMGGNVRSRWVAAADGFALRDGQLVVRALERDADAVESPVELRLDPVSLAPQEN